MGGPVGTVIGTQTAAITGVDKRPSPDEPPPGPAPDLTDQTIAAARAAARRRLLMGQGLSQSFLTGPLGVRGAG